MSYLHNSSSLEQRQESDNLKINSCKQKGITLVQIPYWWDRKLQSLAATINFLRPDLLTSISITSTPISTVEPSNRINSNDIISSSNWGEVHAPMKWFVLIL